MKRIVTHVFATPIALVAFAVGFASQAIRYGFTAGKQFIDEFADEEEKFEFMKEDAK